jgi:hypothetical protein
MRSQWQWHVQAEALISNSNISPVPSLNPGGHAFPFLALNRFWVPVFLLSARFLMISNLGLRAGF